MFNNLNYTAQPDLAPDGIAPMAIIYEQEFYRINVGQDLPTVPRHERWMPTAAGWARFDERVAALVPGTPVCLDFELEPAPGYPWDKGTKFQQTIGLFDAIATEAMARAPGHPIGFYGMMPVDNVLPNLGVAEHVHPRAEMQAHNDMAAPLMQKMGFLAPCLYLNGDPSGYDSRHTETMASISGEATRCAPAVPCYLYISPQQQNTQTNQYPDLPYATAKTYFQNCLTYFDAGVNSVQLFRVSAPINVVIRSVTVRAILNWLP